MYKRRLLDCTGYNKPAQSTFCYNQRNPTNDVQPTSPPPSITR